MSNKYILLFIVFILSFNLSNSQDFKDEVTHVNGKVYQCQIIEVKIDSIIKFMYSYLPHRAAKKEITIETTVNMENVKSYLWNGVFTELDLVIEPQTNESIGDAITGKLEDTAKNSNPTVNQTSELVIAGTLLRKGAKRLREVLIFEKVGIAAGSIVLAYISPIIGVVILAAVPLIALVNELKGLKLIEEAGIILIGEGVN